MDLSYNIDISNSKLVTKIKAINANKMNLFFVLFIYIAGVIFYFCLSNYNKTIAIYQDELLYYGMARSIFQGKGLIVRGVDFGFRKIGYSLLIAPLFAVKDVGLRITMIALLNSLVMVSTVFPAYFIAKEINMKRSGMYLFLILLALWPGMLMSEIFMSEVLYMPLVWWFVYLWIKEQKAPDKIIYPILEGVICFLGYLTKEIFLSFFLTYFLVKLFYPFISAFCRDSEKKEGFRKTVRSEFSLKAIRGAAIFAAVFVLLNVIIGLILFSDSNIYSGALSRELNLYTIVYFFYGIVTYLSAVVISLLVFPAVYPLALFKKMDENVRKLICFVYIALLLSIAVISYTILIAEEPGLEYMRIHLRYISPVMLLIVLLFFRVIFDRDKVSEHLKTNSLATWLSLFFAAIVSLLLFKGLYKGLRLGGPYIDQQELGWFRHLQFFFFGELNWDNDHMTFPLYSIVIGLTLAVYIVLAQLLIKHKKFGVFYLVFMAVMVWSSAANLYYSHSYIKNGAEYSVSYADEMKKISDYIDNISEDESVLCVFLSDLIGTMRRLVDTYIDRTDNIYYVSRKNIAEYDENGFVPVSSMRFVEAASGIEYGTAERIDYIILANGDYKMGFSNIELIPEASGEAYCLYRNLDNAALCFEAETEKDQDQF